MGCSSRKGLGAAHGCECKGTMALRGNSTRYLLNPFFFRGQAALGTYIGACLERAPLRWQEWRSQLCCVAQGLTFQPLAFPGLSPVSVRLWRVRFVGIPVRKAGSPNPATKTLFGTVFANFSGEVSC